MSLTDRCARKYLEAAFLRLGIPISFGISSFTRVFPFAILSFSFCLLQESVTLFLFLSLVFLLVFINSDNQSPTLVQANVYYLTVLSWRVRYSEDYFTHS